MDLKSTPGHWSHIPLPHRIAVRGYGIFQDVSWGLETYWLVGAEMCWTHPLNLPYLEIKRSRLIPCLTMRVIVWSGGQGHWPYLEDHVLLEVSRSQGWSPDHPDSRISLLHFGLNSPRSNISLHASLIQALFISKFNWKSVAKWAGNQEEQWLHWAQVRNNFTYLLRLAITHDCP